MIGSENQSSGRPRILVFSRYYLPGYRGGGPVRSLANMVDRLGDEFDFRVITLDRDLGESLPFQNVLEGWNHVGAAEVQYMSQRKVSLRGLLQIVREVAPDIIYLNSFFDPVFTQRILWLRRIGRLGDALVVLAPRGEFSAKALQIKAMKKNLYIGLSRMLGLHEGLLWQASSAQERVAIQSRLEFVRDADIAEAMNLAPVGREVAAQHARRAPGEPLRICFLSRIAPMKNLDFALRVLAQVRSAVSFTIYGPKESSSYWSECESLIGRLPSGVTVTYGGVLEPSEVHGALAGHDLFLFPTRGENYGHVIHEALDAGLPVLISDQTPWTGIPERCVGWVLPLDDELAFARCIDAYAAWSQDVVAEIKYRAQRYAAERSEDRSALQANRRLFLDALAK